jgi:hypothetical protein
MAEPLLQKALEEMVEAIKVRGGIEGYREDVALLELGEQGAAVKLRLVNVVARANGRTQ